MGYNHIDAAESYNTEVEVGLAIEESKIEREKLFVTTKVSINVKDIPKAINASLKRLGLKYVDLYLIHAPFFAKTDEDLQKAWVSMEEIKYAGKARSIGVSNYLEKHLKATLKTAKIPPSINQIEYHPYLQHDGLIPFQRSHNIAAAAYAPLTAATKAKPGPCDTMYAKLAGKYYVSDGEIALRWCIDQDIVALTTSGKEERLSDYLRATTFNLSPKEVNDLTDVGKGKHYRGFWQSKFETDDKS